MGDRVDEVGMVYSCEIGVNDVLAAQRPLALAPQEYPSLWFFDGGAFSRLDRDEIGGGSFDFRTRSLMRALLDVARDWLDEQDERD